MLCWLWQTVKRGTSCLPTPSPRVAKTTSTQCIPYNQPLLMLPKIYQYSTLSTATVSLTSNSIGLLHVVRPTMPDRMTWRWRGIWTFHLVETNNSTNSHTYKQMTATCKSVILPSSLILVALVPSDLNYCNIVWVTPHRFSLNKLLQVTYLMSGLIIAHTQPGGKTKWCPSTLKYILMVLFHWTQKTQRVQCPLFKWTPNLQSRPSWNVSYS